MPNGTVVPLDSMNGEEQLFDFFADRGETGLDWRQNANAAPDVFSPLCGFQATLLLKESGADPGVGWYNADPGDPDPPSADEIFTIVAPPTTVGETISGADIRDDPNYTGGAVGFALLTNPPHFTEARYNRVCTECTNPGPWTLALIYRSVVTPNAYYVAFEDGPTSSSTYGNDGDYNDDVFLFEGVSCQGEGDACEVPGAQGVCRPGLLECDSVTGEQVCRPLNQAGAETCDGLDNDCDGEVDEEDDESLCTSGLVCSRGTCSPRCSNFEFQCVTAPFTLCDDGLCVDPLCEGVSCEPGQTCVAGACRAACDDVTCPVGQACRLGACVDPCEGVVCDDLRVCEEGACVLSCDCTGCTSPLTCGESGRCESAACDGVRCGAGEFCEDGACVDRCRDAQCPAGEICEAGACVVLLASERDGGAGDGGSGDGGSDDGGSDDGGSDDAGSGAGDAGAGGDAGADAGDAGPDAGSAGGSGDVSGGCSCRTHGGPTERSDATWWLLSSLLAAAYFRRTRASRV